MFVRFHREHWVVGRFHRVSGERSSGFGRGRVTLVGSRDCVVKPSRKRTCGLSSAPPPVREHASASGGYRGNQDGVAVHLPDAPGQRRRPRCPWAEIACGSMAGWPVACGHRGWPGRRCHRPRARHASTKNRGWSGLPANCAGEEVFYVSGSRSGGIRRCRADVDADSAPAPDAGARPCCLGFASACRTSAGSQSPACTCHLPLATCIRWMPRAQRGSSALAAAAEVG